MTWSLSNTITYVNSSTDNTALQYLFDTFLPTVGWSSSAHPSASATKRSLTRSYTNQLTGNTLTNYHWTDFASSNTYIMYEDATYTSVPGDLGTDGTNSITHTYSNAAYSTLDWKFWTSSEKSSASLVTRGKYAIWFDPGVTDVFAYEDTGWNGSTDTGSTHFYPYNYVYSYFPQGNAPTAGLSISEYFVVPIHEGTSEHQPSVDSIIKGFDYGYSTTTDHATHGVAYRITGNDIVLHVPGGGNVSNKNIGGVGLVIQVGSDYYFRLGSNMANVTPMLYMGTSEPNFT